MTKSSVIRKGVTNKDENIKNTEKQFFFFLEIIVRTDLTNVIKKEKHNIFQN